MAQHRSRESQRHVAELRALLGLSDDTPVDAVIAAARRVPNPLNHCRLCVEGVKRKLARGVDIRALEGLRRRRGELIQELEFIENSQDYKRYLKVKELLRGLLDTGSPRQVSGETFEQCVCLDDNRLKKAVSFRLGVRDCSDWKLSRNALWVDHKGRK